VAAPTPSAVDGDAADARSPEAAIISASWFFGTRLTAPMIVGGLIALAGVAIIRLRSAQVGREHGD